MPRLLEAPAEGEVEIASPGAPLVWPGQFVFGYPSTNGGSGDPLPAKSLSPAWLRNGSLLAFRRLRQDVAGFHRFLRAAAAALAATPASDSFPRAKEDTQGFICPRAAHIRKVNPRDHGDDFGDQFDVLIRRILRRGIPYGPPLPVPPGGQLSAVDGVDRGLHFLCCQTSIEQQFEILQQDWANSQRNPKGGGHDIIIGQTQDGVREAELFTAQGEERDVPADRQFVTTTGGGYFFAPSISAIRDVLARQQP